MKKTVALASLLTLLTASTALAEHKLLVTDVPDPGKVEARLDVAYSSAQWKNDLDEKVKDEKSAALASIGVGVVSGLKLSASLPYTLAQHAEGIDSEGLGDITLGARYSLTKSLVSLPFDAAIGLDWKLYSASSAAGHAGSGSNNYAPYLAVSKNLHTVIPYVKYQPEFIVKEHDGRTVHNLTAGAEIEFSHHYSLDILVKGTANGSKRGEKSSTDLEFEVSPYINLVKNLYLLPKVAYKVSGNVEDEAGVTLLRRADEYTLGLGVYYLF